MLFNEIAVYQQPLRDLWSIIATPLAAGTLQGGKVLAKPRLTLSPQRLHGDPYCHQGHPSLCHASLCCSSIKILPSGGLV